MIRVEYQLTFEEFTALYRWVGRPQALLSLGTALAFVGLSGTALVLACTEIDPLPVPLVSVLAVLFVACVIHAIPRVRAITSARSQWSTHRASETRYAVQATAAGLDCVGPEGSTTVLWTDITHARETPELFLLVTRQGQRLCIPKRAFAGAQQTDSFRHLMRRQLHQPQL